MGTNTDTLLMEAERRAAGVLTAKVVAALKARTILARIRKDLESVAEYTQGNDDNETAARWLWTFAPDHAARYGIGNPAPRTANGKAYR